MSVGAGAMSGPNYPQINLSRTDVDWLAMAADHRDMVVQTESMGGWGAWEDDRMDRDRGAEEIDSRTISEVAVKGGRSYRVSNQIYRLGWML